MYLALLLLLPFLLALLAWYILKARGETFFGPLQVGIALGICLLIAGAGLGLEFYGVTSDTEIWSGSITQKQREEVSCRHSYQCNCHEVCTGSGKDETCSEHCDTCYEHSFDVDWDVFSSTGKQISIDTIDRQGLSMPPRWGAAYVGEPTAEAHEFTNYFLAASDDIMLRHDAPKGFEGLVPEYPKSITDYYHCNRFLLGGGVGIRPYLDARA